MLRARRMTNWGRGLAHATGTLVLVLVACGCQTAQFYRQAIVGQSQILKQRHPIKELLREPSTSDELKAKFELILRLRDFARSELKLPIAKHYLSYVDLGRPFAVWNVHAAPEASLEPKKWWYPVVGSLKYRGYFAEKDARQYGAQLAAKGNDVYVEGVEAFSTLGWFSDPVLNTFIHHPEPGLAEILFHELAHQRLFLNGDTDFNEAFATAVEEEGVRRWLLACHGPARYERYQVALAKQWQFVAVIMRARTRLEDLYGASAHPGVSPGTATRSAPPWMKEEKARILSDARDDYERLKRSWGGDASYDDWFAQPLNNAQMNTVAVYYELVPGFQALLREQAGDLEAFYRAVSGLRKLSKEARHRFLKERG